MSKKIYIVPAVSHAVELVAAVAQGRARNNRELGALTGVSASSVYRIVGTLLARGWLEEDDGGRLVLGGAFTGLLRGVPLDALRVKAQPVLEAVRDRCGLTSKLSVRDGREFVMVARAESTRSMSLTAKVGARESLCLGSSGAVLLAGLDEAGARECVRLAPRAAWKHQTQAQLLARVAAARAGGFCMDGGESHPGIFTASCRVALAPFEAALTVIGMQEDFSGNRAAKLRASLLKARATLERGGSE